MADGVFGVAAAAWLARRWPTPWRRQAATTIWTTTALCPTNDPCQRRLWHVWRPPLTTTTKRRARHLPLRVDRIRRLALLMDAPTLGRSAAALAPRDATLALPLPQSINQPTKWINLTVPQNRDLRMDELKPQNLSSSSSRRSVRRFDAHF